MLSGPPKPTADQVLADAGSEVTIWGRRVEVCASINEQVVHGIPSKKRVIEEGDIISIDADAGAIARAAEATGRVSASVKSTA